MEIWTIPFPVAPMKNVISNKITTTTAENVNSMDERCVTHHTHVEVAFDDLVGSYRVCSGTNKMNMNKSKSNLSEPKEYVIFNVIYITDPDKKEDVEYPTKIFHGNMNHDNDLEDTEI